MRYIYSIQYNSFGDQIIYYQDLYTYDLYTIINHEGCWLDVKECSYF